MKSSRKLYKLPATFTDTVLTRNVVHFESILYTNYTGAHRTLHA